MVKLIKLNRKHKRQFFDMMDEWNSSNERIIPYILTRIDYHYFDIFIRDVERVESHKLNTNCELYFCYDTTIKTIVGAVCIRTQLTEDLLERGGHIALGIRPSLRNKGYGTKLVELAVNKCFEVGMDNVLLVCEKSNIFSAKAILKNNGKLENEVQLSNSVIQRFWVTR